MYCKAILALFAILSFGTVNAQWQWARQSQTGGWGWGNYDSYATLNCTDNQGNVYVVGHFGTDSLGLAATVLHRYDTSIFASTIEQFIVKYDSNGNILWAENMAGFTPSDVTTDKYGNLYVAGRQYENYIKIGDSIETPSHNNISPAAIFVKISTTGQWLGCTQKFGGGSARCLIEVDDDMNIYMAGSFLGAAFGHGSVTVYNSDLSGNTLDIFIIKTDSTFFGGPVWLKTLPFAGNNTANSITIDKDHNVLIAGCQHPYYPGIGELGTVDYRNGGDIFLVKLDANGNQQWLRQAQNQGDLSVVNTVKTDNQGNIYIIGRFSGQDIDFDNVTLSMTGAYPYDHHVFLVKYDTAGTLVWAKQTTGFSGFGGMDIATDKHGRLWISGSLDYFQPVVLDNESMYFTPDNCQNWGTFIAALDTSGNVEFSSVIKTSWGVGAISTDSLDNVFFTGYFECDSLNLFGNVLRDTHTVMAPSLNMVTLRFKAGAILPPSLNSIELTQPQKITIYPNPASEEIRIALTEQAPATGTIRLFNTTGSTLVKEHISKRETKLNTRELPPGLYFCEVNANGRSEIFKVLIVH